MLESKDPAIKLFGKKIPFPAAEEKLKSGGDRDVEVEEEDQSAEKGTSMEKSTEGAEEDISESMEKENHEDSKSKGEDEDENSKEMEKPLKKPSKILPCPRCNSMDTKFCYYNNYNINQPRHFCKACQRYWTAGGTMRNVPVGAGRRKNKNLSSHYRHISISEALQASRIDSTHPGLKTNGRILSFGLEAQHAPICDSMASVLKLGDQKVLINGAKNRFHSSGDQRVMARIENGDDCSSVTSINNQSTDESRSPNCRVPEAHMMKNNHMNGFPCIPNVPWPYTWNPSIPPAPFFPPPGFPMPFYPYWSIPMASPQISSSGQKGLHPPGSNSPTLGKHSRDEETAKKDGSEERNGCVLVPKTLRVDDPKEAAKSSIWTTLGIKNERMSKGGMFKGFDQKTSNKTVDTSPLLRANPAALSRSFDFHERI